MTKRMQELENILMEYFNDNLSQTDRVEIEKWAEKSNENQLIFNQVKRLHELSEFVDEGFEPDVDRAWKKVQSKVYSQPLGKQAFIGLKYFYRVAAVLIFALSIGMLSYVVSNTDLAEVATNTGERKEIKLPDGTIILLNEESKLRYDEDFDDDKRIVYLEGQAFFNVARDEKRPFEIVGKPASITVLGTSFDLISKEKFAQVNVNSGKVSFKSNLGEKRELILTKNQQGTLAENELSKIESLDDNAIAWRFEDLVFRSTPLKEVVGQLAKFYDVQFEMDATIENCLITTSFTNQTLEEALNVLEVIANIKNEHTTGDAIKLSGPGC